MALVTTKDMLLRAQAGGYAVGAFNIENMEMAQAVVAVAEELRAPVLIQTTSSTCRYGTLALYRGMIGALAEAASVPVALHLDHGDSYELAVAAMEAGYTSVMIDGSHVPFEENVALTKRVVDAAQKFGIPVEAELGKVGGKEDDVESDGDTNTDPAEAAEFASRTGVDSLAVAIGTAHGFYRGTPVLDKERLSEIRRVVSVPLVLHGASGLSEQDVKDCIARGICKVNIATELRVAFTDGLKAVFADKPETFDPKPLGLAGEANVRAVVAQKIRMCGCDGKA